LNQTRNNKTKQNKTKLDCNDQYVLALLVALLERVRRERVRRCVRQLGVWRCAVRVAVRRVESVQRRRCGCVRRTVQSVRLVRSVWRVRRARLAGAGSGVGKRTRCAGRRRPCARRFRDRGRLHRGHGAHHGHARSQLAVALSLVHVRRASRRRLSHHAQRILGFVERFFFSFLGYSGSVCERFCSRFFFLVRFQNLLHRTAEKRHRRRSRTTALSLFKLLHSLYAWLRGPPPQLKSNLTENVADFLAPRPPRRSAWRLALVLGGIALLVGPWLYQRLAEARRLQRRRAAMLNSSRRSSSSSSSSSSSMSTKRNNVNTARRASRRLAADIDAQLDDANNDNNDNSSNSNDIDVNRASTAPRFGDCIADVRAESARELSLARGEVVRIAVRDSMLLLMTRTTRQH
jgi:hypothetical protein